MLDAVIHGSEGNIMVQAEGDVAEICADIYTMIHTLYVNMFEDDLLQALLFRSMFEKNVSRIFVLDTEELHGEESEVQDEESETD